MDTSTQDATTGEADELSTLTGLLREAEDHHGQYEPSAPPHHWSDWYAAYVLARQRGRTPEDAYADASQHVAEVLR